MPTATATATHLTAAQTATKKPSHKTYTVRGQKRALFTLGTGDDSKLMDVPFALLDIAATGQPTPDSYLVEEGLRQCDRTGELAALLTDYLAIAERHQAVPMTVLAMTPELQAHAA